MITDSIIWEDYCSEKILETDRIHVFKISIDIYEKIEKSCREILQENELQKAEKFRQHDDKRRFIIGIFFSKVLLTKLGELDASDVIFSFTKNNKPLFKDYHFNVSHSGNFVVIVLSPLPVGVDIELIKANFDFESLLPECFNKIEIEKIINTTNFYTFWTRKEALLKATGEGLVDNLNSIDCSKEFVERFGSIYKLKSYKVEDNYLLSLAVKNSNYHYKYWDLKV
ncbi:4'-phosphopantetheinyl transferase family protein [Pedobacter jamesrossensis]|uniref:4'-phosphopantetheinyl transferase family protein n=1 Tax=Pedobacter jamesrossensis TaxID=1908238 RepID=A0ABV8NMX8_9SPHI